jgi:hypothetical protein
MTLFPNTEPEFIRAWMHTIGELSGMKWAKKLLSDEAGVHFWSGKDELAQYLRDLGKSFQIRIDELERKIQEYDNEAKRRNK